MHGNEPVLIFNIGVFCSYIGSITSSWPLPLMGITHLRASCSTLTGATRFASITLLKTNRRGGQHVSACGSITPNRLQTVNKLQYLTQKDLGHNHHFIYVKVLEGPIKAVFPLWPIINKSLTSSPFFPGGPAGPRGPMAPLKKKHNKVLIKFELNVCGYSLCRSGVRRAGEMCVSGSWQQEVEHRVQEVTC